MACELTPGSWNPPLEIISGSLHYNDGFQLILEVLEGEPLPVFLPLSDGVPVAIEFTDEGGPRLLYENRQFQEECSGELPTFVIGAGEGGFTFRSDGKALGLGRTETGLRGISMDLMSFPVVFQANGTDLTLVFRDEPEKYFETVL